MPISLINRRTGKVIAAGVDRPGSLLPRLLGLLACPPLREGEGLWLDPCGGIHTGAMGYAIDAVFLDSSRKVLFIRRAMPPWRIALPPKDTRSVLELPAGVAA